MISGSPLARHLSSLEQRKKALEERNPKGSKKKQWVVGSCEQMEL